MASWLDIRKEFLGLRGFHIHVVDVSVEVLMTALSALDFKLYRIDGSKILDERTFFTEVAQVFDFPAYFGHNWDALNDCWGDIDFSAQRIAIVWEYADQTLSADVQTFLEAVCTFYDFAVGLGTYDEDESKIIQMEVFLVGHGRGFNVKLNLGSKS